MIKETLYQYLGTNGTILSPIHLEDTYYVRKIKLIADYNKILIKNNNKDKAFSIIIPEEEVPYWREETLAESE